MRFLARKVAYAGILLVVVLLAIWGLSQVATWRSPTQVSLGGDRDGSIVFENRKRTYLLHFPPAYDGRASLPLVIVLHGGGGSALGAVQMTGFSDEADLEGFIVMYPDGTGVLGDRVLTWNSGNCCGYAMDNNVNDVGFIDALITKLEAEFQIDSSRIFATGISNGGMMAYRLGCELSGKIAAIGPVAGALNVACTPSHPLSVVAFHGTDDQHVLYSGGVPVSKFDPRGRVDKSVAFAISFWVQRDGCGTTPSRTSTGHIILDVYSNCSDGTGVTLYTIVGGLHAWPGGKRGSTFGDQPTREIAATHVMWEFFKQHPGHTNPSQTSDIVGDTEVFQVAGSLVPFLNSRRDDNCYGAHSSL